MAGTPLARFGGFLDAGWRDNDWYWGRMDGAAGVVEILTAPAGSEGAARNRSSSPRTDTATIVNPETFPNERDPAASVGRDRSAAAKAARTTAQELAFQESQRGGTASPLETVGAESLADLPAGYRYGIVARVAPLALRAVNPRDTKSFQVSRWLVKAGLLLARVVVPPLVLAVDPMRAALVGGVALATAVMLGVGAADMGWQIGFAVVLFLSGTIMALRGLAVPRRWQPIGDFAEAYRPDGDPVCCAGVNCVRETYDVSRARARIWWTTQLFVGLAAAIGGIAMVFWAIGHPSARQFGWEVIVLALAVVVAGGVWLNSRCLTVKSMPPEQRSRWRRQSPLRIVGAIAVVVLVILTCLATWCRVGMHVPHGIDSGGVWAGVVAGLAVALMTATSLASWTSWDVLIVVAIWFGVSAGVLQFLLDHGSGWADLLPVAVWAVAVGLILPVIPPMNTYAWRVSQLPVGTSSE